MAEKIDRILENKVPFEEVVAYYVDFTIYFANLLFPFIFIFIGNLVYLKISQQH